MALVRKLAISPILKNDLLTEMNKIKQFLLVKKVKSDTDQAAHGNRI
jgi:hypothetical protein